MAIINGIEERVLIDRMLNDDQTAFELIFRFYYPGLLIFTKQIVLDHEEAEEIVQDFFVQLWVGRNKIKKTDSLKNYFFVSVKNRAFNLLNKQKVRKKALSEIEHMVETDLLYQPDLFIVSELQDQITATFDKLPNRTREIFLLSRTKGLSNDEIADQLKLSKRTVETQISNALKILRHELKDYIFLLCVMGITGL